MIPDRLPDAAFAYGRMGLPIIPLAGKVPALREWQFFAANEVNLCLWWGKRHWDIGLRTGRDSSFTVVDTDTEQAENWVRTHVSETPMTARSAAGAGTTATTPPTASPAN